MNSAFPVERLYSESVVLQSVVDEQPEAFTIIGLLILGIGLANIYLDRSKKATASRLKETDVTDIGSVRDGTVAVSGIARPAEETLERPVSDGECLAFEQRTHTTRETVENNHDNAEQRDTSFDTTTSSSFESTAFYVEDDTGTVLITNDETPTLHLAATDSLIESPDPEELAEKRRRRRNKDSYRIITEKDHRFSELLPGDEVFIFGQAHRRLLDDGDGVASETDIRITEDRETGDFVVTHYDKDWLLEKHTSNVQLLIGLVASVLSLAFLAFIWLP